MESRMSEKPEWKWSYSPWVGYKYGPVPVGLIATGVIMLSGLAYAFFQHHA